MSEFVLFTFLSDIAQPLNTGQVGKIKVHGRKYAQDLCAETTYYISTCYAISGNSVQLKHAFNVQKMPFRGAKHGTLGCQNSAFGPENSMFDDEKYVTFDDKAACFAIFSAVFGIRICRERLFNTSFIKKERHNLVDILRHIMRSGLHFDREQTDA